MADVDVRVAGAVQDERGHADLGQDRADVGGAHEPHRDAALRGEAATRSSLASQPRTPVVGATRREAGEQIAVPQCSSTNCAMSS